MLRTADAIGAEHVYMVGYTPAGDHRSVHKSALGAQDEVPWSHHASLEEVIRILEQDGVTLAAVEITDSPTDPRTISAEHYPIALLVGNEVTGVSAAGIGARPRG